MPSPSALDPMPAADAATLAQLQGCTQVDLLLADMNGLLRGKRVAVEALGKVYRDGVCLPMSLLGTDICGNTVEETGLGYEIGDADRICRPLAGSLRPVPWQSPPMAQLLLNMEGSDNGNFAASPRRVLQRLVEQFTQRGLTPVVAVELEFYLLDPTLSTNGRPRTSINPVTGDRNDATQVYYMQDLVDYQAFTNAVAAACKAQGIVAETAVAEYAPGQFEINLAHRPSALAACDDSLLLKRTIKAVAEQQGMLASFMAKPFVDQAGSGAHIHLSVLDQHGENIFASSVTDPAPALLHALGGLQSSGRQCMLLYAPHANSYRRFVRDAFVPLNECWGYNNRTVALRIPHSDDANTRIEHRIAGADANPYLVTASVLAGVLDGLDRRLDPGPPISGNAYQSTQLREPYWRQSIDEFLCSGFVAKYLGEEFRHVYGQQKRKEMRSFDTQVTDVEYRWYLRAL